MMKKVLLQWAYQPDINRIARNLLKPVSKALGKPLISVSGKLPVKVDNISFHLHTNQTCSVTQVLFYEGAENYEFTSIFKKMILHTSVFLDIGANIGYFSILAAKLNPRCKTFAFEPSSGALHYLKQNVTSNHVSDQVTIVDKAVSDQAGKLEFFVVDNPKYPWIKHNLNGSNSLQNIHGKQKRIHYPVEVTTLEDVVDIHQLQSVDFMKIDVECTEHLVLRSSMNLIKKFRPVMVCEVYPVIMEDIQQILDELDGYLSYACYEGKLFPVSKLKDSPINDNNFFFCPKEKENLLREFIRED
jgi:FkbM family methyltransferase